MIRVKKSKEPHGFDERCRKRGCQWLADHPGYKRPRDYWSEFEAQLRSAFAGLCGYCAMTVMKGQIDHFVDIETLKEKGKGGLAYEWTNFRYADGSINQRKLNARVLDPHTVRNEWFELLLPSLQLVLTSKVPENKRSLAEFTLVRLGLRDGEVVVRYRAKWFGLYRKRELNLEGLRAVAPLIAFAVERDLGKGLDWSS